jgi:hypothetical protein
VINQENKVKGEKVSKRKYQKERKIRGKFDGRNEILLKEKEWKQEKKSK